MSVMCLSDLSTSEKVWKLCVTLGYFNDALLYTWYFHRHASASTMWEAIVLFFLVILSQLEWSRGETGFQPPLSASIKHSILSSSSPLTFSKTSLHIHYEDNGIVLTKDSKSIKLRTELDGSLRIVKVPTSKTRSIESYVGVFGCYNLPGGKYLLLVRDMEKSVSIANFNILKAKSFQFVRIPSLKDNAIHSRDRMATLKRKQRHRFVEALLLDTLNKHSFYYSTGDDYNLQASFQTNFEGVADHAVDDRYFWNAQSAKVFLEAGLDYLVPRMCSAWVSSFDFPIHEVNMTCTLLSRRSKCQQGPRYIKRGADSNAEVANYVELEQIVTRCDRQGVSSFVQIRGSIPLKWSQPEPWKLKPPIVLPNDMVSCSTLQRQYMEQIIRRYCNKQSPNYLREPSVYLVNLIDKKGTQGELGRYWFEALKSAFVSESENPSDLRDQTLSELLMREKITKELFTVKVGGADHIISYLWFDYHFKIKHEGVVSLKDLHRALLGGLSWSRGGFFVKKNASLGQERNPTLRSWQSKIIRTNCVDCLDRTNVMQATIGRWIFLQQISCLVDKFRISDSSSLALPFESLELQFRSLWAENGDHLSTLYAGSRAMKRDVTRTGRRTKMGVVDDALSFAQRYVVNNYRDSTFQKAVDFILGSNDDPGFLVDAIMDDQSKFGDATDDERRTDNILLGSAEALHNDTALEDSFIGNSVNEDDDVKGNALVGWIQSLSDLASTGLGLASAIILLTLR